MAWRGGSRTGSPRSTLPTSALGPFFWFCLSRHSKAGLWYNLPPMANQKIDVGYVAELARLELTESEKATFQGQLEDIVKYVEKISSVDVEGVPPTMHGREIVNAFREDEVRPSMDREAALANAPRRTENEFYLPKIVEGAES